MKTILVLAEHPQFAEDVSAALNPERYRVVHRSGGVEAEPLLNEHLVDACIVDTDLQHIQEIWQIEKIKRQLTNTPIFVFADSPRPEWQEEAYLHGVSHIMAKPVRARLLQALLDRAFSRTERSPAWQSEFPAPVASVAQPIESPNEAPLSAFGTLSALRDFSAILGESLCAEALLRQFLLLLREVIGVNRSAVFLRQSSDVPRLGETKELGRSLQSACAMGLPSGVLDHFGLSLDRGIGGHLYRHGRILRRESLEARSDATILREFEVLGVEVAVPVFDREALVGIALFDGRVTGESLSNAELGLIFHLLEAIGLAIKNIWLHDQLAANHEIMSDVLRQFSSGCVVVGHDLSVMHANKAARILFGHTGQRGSQIEFSDLPHDLGSRIYQVLKTGTAIAPFRHHPPDSPESVYFVSVMPVQSRNAVAPNSALMIVEDHSQHAQLRRLEVEASNLRLVKQMADRLAHEVGNAMVPLSTHQQLFAKKYKDPEFCASLDTALTEGVRRVTRLVSQMRLLARDGAIHRDVFALAPLVEEAYQEAQKLQPVKSAQLKYNIGDDPILVSGDRVSLKHAMVEIMLNALQANPTDARIAVEMESGGSNGRPSVVIVFQDNGDGFTAESAARASEPFYTTRNVGLGLGLVVSRKVIESHDGRLEITAPKKKGESGVVRLSLPVANISMDHSNAKAG